MILTSHFITLDGVVQAPEQWHTSFDSDEQIDALRDQLAGLDALLLGRRTYEEFAAYWPQQGDDVPLARETNGLHKLVVSSRDEVGYQPAEVIAADVATAVREVNRRGLAVGVPGATRLTRALLAADAVDEMQLFLDPVVLGTGERLFDGDVGQTRLTLTGTRELPHGVVHLTYRRPAR
ncbi:dihydrofolate reductase family protein [Georgenia alba]|uniref:Dihydrofolate reductase family protein n=1 Tax=Georgenia alba TaxID=2233858 RepID=A0ABW2QAF7_9MICO